MPLSLSTLSLCCNPGFSPLPLKPQNSLTTPPSWLSPDSFLLFATLALITFFLRNIISRTFNRMTSTNNQLRAKLVLKFGRNVIYKIRASIISFILSSVLITLKFFLGLALMLLSFLACVALFTPEEVWTSSSAWGKKPTWEEFWAGPPVQ